MAPGGPDVTTTVSTCQLWQTVIHYPTWWTFFPAGRLYHFQQAGLKDLHKGYLQVPVAGADIAKTAIITPF
jgi:hypothetical protein